MQKTPSREYGSLLISIALACLVWAIFYPGILSVDSISTYQEALTGQFSDIRPPLLAFALFACLKAGGTLAGFMLAQSVLGFLGVRRLLQAVVSLFSDDATLRESIVITGLLVLVLPLSPMPLYLVTLWFDSWLIVLLFWVTALLLKLSTQAAPRTWELATGVVLVSLVMLIRWNAFVLYAPLSLLMLRILADRGSSRVQRLGLTLAPLMIYLAFLTFQYEVIGVRRAHNERVALALDLASLIVFDPTLCKELRLSGCDVIVGQITPEFIVGNGAIDHTLNQGQGTMEPAFLRLVAAPTLTSDLRQAAVHRPLTYLQIKLLNFWDYIRPRDRYYFQAFMHPNGLGLALDPGGEVLRRPWLQFLHITYEHPWLRLISFVPLLWLILNVAGLGFCWRERNRSQQARVLGGALLIPAAYFGSYLLALTASDLRFMYPAMLFLQVMLIGAVPALWPAAFIRARPIAAARQGQV